jgi:hypothetical protein
VARRSGRARPATARARLSRREVDAQQASQLPDREALSLLLPSGGALPTDLTGAGGTDPALAGTPAGAGAGYAGSAPDTALTQTAGAQDAALNPDADATTQNAPNGTATASSST